MRLSCNGCRVLRKGCNENCSIRPCLQWIKSPEAQANATVFLAKFYGRAGLMNLINAGPDHIRPAIFRSLLYEACGRIVNPIYGSVGLLWSGNWQMCQSAVEAVLKGAPIVQISSEAAAANPTPPLKAYDIRHVTKDQHAAGEDLHKVAKSSRARFKRASSASSNPKAKSASPQPRAEETEQADHSHEEDAFGHDLGHESSASHDHADYGVGEKEANGEGGGGLEESDDTDVEAAGSHVSQAEQSAMVVPQAAADEEDDEVGLDLTLGLATVARVTPLARPVVEAGCDLAGPSTATGHVGFQFF